MCCAEGGDVGLLAVAGGDDVRLHRVFGRVRRIACDDGSLVESAGAQVGAAARLAAVTAAAQYDRALLLHRTPASAREAALEVGAQVARLRVTAAQREFGRAVVLEHSRDVRARLRRDVLILRAALRLGEEPVLEVSQHPRSVAGAGAPGCDGA